MLHNIMEKYKGLSIQLKATIWFFVCSVLQRGISVITTPIFTRLLTAEEYGQFNVFNSWLSVITVFVTLQLSAGVYTMGIVKFKEDESEFTSSLQGLNLVLCLLWTVIYLLFQDFWNGLFTLTTIQMLAMLLMIWSSAAFNFWMTTQRNHYRYRPLVIATLIVSIAKPVMGILFVLNANDKVTARILGLMLVEVVGYSFAFFVQMKRGKKFCSLKYWKYAITFNLPLVPHYLAGSVLSSSDRIMIQRIDGAASAGIYSLAYSVSQIMLMVNEALNKTMSPWIYQKIRSKEYHLISGIVYASLGIVAIANLFLIAIAPELVAIFAPAEYYEAIYVIPPIAMSVFFSYMYLCFAPFEFYYEKRIWTTIGTFTSAALNILLNAIFINIYGYAAAGYTTLICYMMNAAMHYYFMRKVCKQYMDGVKPYEPKILLGMSIGFIMIGLFYIPTYSNVPVRFGISLLFFVILIVKRKQVLTLCKGVFKGFGK